MLSPAELREIHSLLNAKRHDGSPVATPEERDQLLTLIREQAEFEQKYPWAKYRFDPIGYCRDILDVKLTPQQEAIMQALFEPPYRVHVDSAHSTGKTFLAACVINFWFDSFDPGVIVTTAPTYKSVVDVLWGEVRMLRASAKKKFNNYPMPFIGPRAPEMRTSEEHYAVGLTADKGESLHGKHYERMLFVFDESEGLANMYYTTTASMFQPNGKHAWLSICNPTTLSSPAYMETRKFKPDGSPLWKLFRLNALDHPNIEAELSGKPPPIPAAITVGHIQEMIHQYRCEPIHEEDKTESDFKFPPDKNCECVKDAIADPNCNECGGVGTITRGGRWWRPGPEAEPRILGRRPTVGAAGVWNEALWSLCEQAVLQFPTDEPPEIGCDVARVLGGDDCDIHVRWGGISLHHESANGRPIPDTAVRLKELADQWCEWANARLPEGAAKFYSTKIPIKIDDCGIGGALIDLSGPYYFVPVNAGHAAALDEKYPRVRDELWFETAERARLGGISLAMLPSEWKEKLRIQAFAPLWRPDARKRRVVETKEQTKTRIGRSPDGMDAFNLAYYENASAVPHWIGDEDEFSNTRSTFGAKSGLLGRGPSQDDLHDRNRGRLEREREGKIRTLGRGLR